MSKWFIGRGFIEKEQRQLRKVVAQRERNSRLLKKEQWKLKQELIHQLSGLKGLSLSFGAGCAAVLAYRNREYLGCLKNLPWDEIVQLAQEYRAPEQEPVTDQPQTSAFN